jgi:hypothetical protein
MRTIVFWLVVSSAMVLSSAEACCAQNTAGELAPGIKLPSTGSAWALGLANDKPVLVLVKHHDVKVNNHTGENLAAVPLLSRSKSSIDVVEPHSPLQLESAPSVFLARMYTTADDDALPAHPESQYQLIRLEPEGKGRLVHKFEYSRFKGKPKRVDDPVEATITVIPGSEWLKIVPAQPLPPGEYAIEAKMVDPSAYSLLIYDFGVAPPSAKKD